MRTPAIFAVLFLFCGCSFDLSALRGPDGGTDSSEMADASSDPDASPDAPGDLDAPMDDPDAPVDVDAAEDDGGSVLTCDDLPDISGRYALYSRIDHCDNMFTRVIPLYRTGPCTYEFDGGDLFGGPCTTVIEGDSYSYECTILRSWYTYTCIIRPRPSGTLDAMCTFLRGPGTSTPSLECSTSLPRAP